MIQQEAKKTSKFRVSLAFLFSVSLSIFLFSVSFAATNIDSTYHWAWNDVIGWIDFYGTNNVNVYNDRLEGYASSTIGDIALNCNSTPNGNICSSYNFKVSNDGSGNLTGWAWNDNIGWISFDSASATSSYTYQVTINTTTGDFSGWAWNDVVGWLSFNCNNSGIGDTCSTSNYKVETSWVATSTTGSLTSSIFDTGLTNGAAINTIMWQGSKPSGTNVRFQISSNSSLTGGGTGAIDTTYRYAWNDNIGWIDFGYTAGNVTVGDTQLTGYAYDTGIAEIALDCATSPSGNICSTSNFKVSRSPSTGDLSGWAWNDTIGWISFNCSDPNLCGSSNYKVNVNLTTGAFTNYAWNDNIGWISFNCSDPGTCGSSDYLVNTYMGATWSYLGPDGSATTYYTPSDVGAPIQINLAQHNNKRYFRYKVFLESDAARTLSPRVDDIIINYSP